MTTTLIGKLQRHALLLLGILLTTAFTAPSPARQTPSRDQAPEWRSGPWINSPPLQVSALKGKVVVLEFWTYG
jgi:hypothetical protein